jgi:hypothetical protein
MSVMKKKKDVRKEKIINILSSHLPIKDEKAAKKAFQGLVEEYPELISYEKFDLILKSSNNAREIADRIMEESKKKKRMEREDAFRSKRGRVKGKYKGRKKSEIIIKMKKAFEIISMIHIDEWEKDFDVKINQWLNLLEMFESGDYDYESLVRKSGLPREAIHRIIDEQFVLWDVYEYFKDRVARTSERNNAEDRIFIKSVRKLWGNYAKYVLPEGVKLSRAGRNVSYEAITDRRRRGYEYCVEDGNRVKSGTFYSRDVPTFLIWLSLKIFILLFRKYTRKEDEHQRLKVIGQIYRLMLEHGIKPSDI